MAEAARLAATVPYSVVCRTDDEANWLELRRTGIGASEMPILLGASEWGSNLDIYYSKVEGLAEERQEHEWLQWGKILESAIVSELSKRAGVRIEHAGIMLRSNEHPWALATLDSMTADGEPVEVKNLAWGFDVAEWAAGIPEKYRIQTHQQMLVAGTARVLFGALLHGQRMLWEWVPRDETLIQRIVQAGDALWRRVEEKRPPPADGHPNARKTLSRFARAENAIELDAVDADMKLLEWRSADDALAEIRVSEKKAVKRRDAAANQIAQLMGNARQAYTPSGWELRWETVDRNGYTVAAKSFEQFKIKPPKG